MSPYSSDGPDRRPSFPYAVAELLPQAGNMVLVDQVLEVGDDHILVGLRVREDGLFSGPDRTVPAWVGLEYMAQAIAAFSGYQRKRRGEAIGLGFLLGTRHYECSADSFPCGTNLTVRAEKIIEGTNDMAVFDCAIDGGGIRAASKLNVLLPQDSKKFLAEKGL